MKENNYCLTESENGIIIVSKHLPQATSVSLGIRMAAGARDESSNEEGLAHLLEHMAFKGTTSRSALEVAKALDLLGGMCNAYTSREATFFYARVMSSRLADAFEILTDIILSPALDSEDLGREQDVILQEIALVEDSPEECLQDLFWEKIWTDQTVGHPILGRAEQIVQFTPAELRNWRAQTYATNKIIIAAAGGIEHGELNNLVNRAFGHSLEETFGRTAQKTRPPLSALSYQPGFIAKYRDTEQNHICLAFPACGAADPKRFVYSVMNTLIGGNMSSILFQEIREKRGLAYSVYSFLNILSDAGVLQINASVNPDKTIKTIEVILEKISDIARGNIETKDLEHAKEHLLSMLYLGAETTEDHMLRLARHQALFGRSFTVEELAEQMAGVGIEELREAAQKTFTREMLSIGILGPKLYESYLSELTK